METYRLLLRPFQDNDFNDLLALYQNPEVTRYLGGIRSRQQIQDKLAGIMAHWQQHGFGIWALFSKPDGSFIGRCGCWYKHDPSEPELAYALTPPCWGKGLASEAAKAAIDMAFGRFKLPSIIAFAHAENHASHRVMTKLGMQQVDKVQLHGCDVVKYRLVNTP